MKQKYELEFTINSSPKVLYTRLSTPGGLAEWFADDVNQGRGYYSFIWEGYPQEAEILQKKDNHYIRFRWIEDRDSEDDQKAYFEFRVRVDDLTGDVALMITDFADEDEIEDAKELWSTQIEKLKQVIGL